MVQTFIVEGRPKPKQRPRVVRGGRAFTPKETLEAEQKIRDAYINQCGGYYWGDKPVEVCMTFIFPIAESWSKKKKADAIAGKLKMTSTPDVDNLVKLVLDGLGTFFKNDSYVINVVANKEYGEKGQTIVWLKDVV